jgi:hypothetical protein
MAGGRNAVDGGSGREHEVLHARLRSGFQQRTRGAGVVAVVLERVADRFGNDRVRGEVDDGVHAVFGEQAVHQPAIADIAHHERHVTHRLAKAGG